MDVEQAITTLQAELREVRQLLRDQDVVNLVTRTSPYALGEHLQWMPDDPNCVARFQIALGDNYFNHGGLLRVTLASGQLVEVPPGAFVTFAPAKWTVVDVPGAPNLG
jgi:hypothetical protein